MPVQAQSADGVLHEFPDGTDPNVIDKVMKDYAGSAQPAAAAKPLSFGERAVEGLADPLYGTAQLISHVTPDSVVAGVSRGEEALLGMSKGSLPSSSAEIDANLQKRETRISAGSAAGRNEDTRTYLQSLLRIGTQNGWPKAKLEEIQGKIAALESTPEQAPAGGMDSARLIGNVANPINYAIPGEGAASTAGMLARAGMQGGLAAASQPVTSGDFWGHKGTQTAVGVGTAVGGAYLINKLANALAPMTSGGGGQNTDDILAAGAKKEGIDLKDLPPDVVASVRQDVQTAIQSGKELNPDEVVRLAQFRTLGMEPLQSQITRDPTQFAKDVNLRGVTGAGEPLAARAAEHNTQLIENLNQRGAATAPSPYEASQKIAGSLQQGDEAAKAGVTAAYTGARGMAGRDAMLSPDFAETARKALDEKMVGEFLPPAVQARLDRIGSGQEAFPVSRAVQWDSVLSAEQRSATGSAKTAIGIVRDALNGAEIAPMAAEAQRAGVGATLGSQATAAGEETMQAFRAARSLAKARFDNIKATPALKAVVEDAAPDNLFQKFVLGGNVREVQSLGRNLDEPTKEAVQQAIVGHLKSQALTGASDEVGKFSQAAYNKALNKIGPDRLKVFFTPREIAELRIVGNVASYIQAAPAGAAVNTSNTASAVMNLVGDKVSKLPGWTGAAAKFVTGPVRTVGQMRAADQALRVTLGREPSQVAVQALHGILIPLSGATGAAAGAATQ